MINKKLFKVIYIVISLTIVVMAIKKLHHIKKIEEGIVNLPSFNFKNMENRLIYSDSIIKKNYIIVNYFKTSCDHCKMITKEYITNRSKLNNTQIIMVSADDIKDINQFYIENNLYSLPMITLLWDSEDTFQNVFGSSIAPSFFIYRDKKMVKKVVGETKFQNLMVNE
jgi:peroxiredoxin